jgi:hypothetical protein
LVFGSSSQAVASQEDRRPEEKTQLRYSKQSWFIGANYIPADAINQLEMQAATFNPSEIDHELGLAQSIGMNTMRVFMHDLAWQQDLGGASINSCLSRAGIRLR